ncbi:SDR family oxidoreductase [Pseudomonas sp. JUb96]|uniref:SDR family oxidoreductase n=1 Tax=Pseudomonas sp. JUb96 TaxID=2940539 RepID=UPI002227FC6A|nr:SDR family oxidoreductase [Pseudomonas sp. JUb96]MCW2271542.1 short-subunit dehydrogenase [Pseudomonas sp. JUb96]
MIDPATGMKPGQRYTIEIRERTRQFPGFFLDGKYYLGPELLTAIGWMEGKRFIYDDIDPEGEPVFPDRVAGTLENLRLTLADGAKLQLAEMQYESQLDAQGVDAPTTHERSQRLPIGSPLEGKLVVITGASSGIGRAAAHAFACKGARLVLAARDEAALFEVVDECTDCGTEVLAVQTDVTSNDQMRALASQAAAFGGGRIDIWINNAGVGAVGRFAETPLEAHEQVLQTDLLGYLRGAYVVWPYFKAQKNGVLINTLSLGSWVAQPYAVAYSAAKYGLRGLSEALRGELNGFPGIHVCDIYPAVMDTPGFRDGGNFTGHALKPPPPVYDPRRVARAMVQRAISPRPHTTVGNAATLARLAHLIVPGFNRLSGLLTRWGLTHSDETATSSGNLFEPARGARRVEGGWRTAHRTAPKTHLLGGVLLIAGVLYAVDRASRRKRDH